MVEKFTVLGGISSIFRAHNEVMFVDGILRGKLENNIKIDLKQTRCDVHWIQFAGQWRVLVNTLMLLRFLKRQNIS
jgi:hypothetical protein